MIIRQYVLINTQYNVDDDDGGIQLYTQMNITIYTKFASHSVMNVNLNLKGWVGGSREDATLVGIGLLNEDVTIHAP